MIRIDENWLAIEPMNMRADPDTALARVVQVFGAAKPPAWIYAISCLLSGCKISRPGT